MIESYVFTPLERAIRAHDETVGNILKEYREQLKKASETYQPQVLADYKVRLIESARKRVEAADNKLSTACKDAASRLRMELTSYSSRPVDSGMLANLSTLKDFGLKLSKPEIETYVKQAAGNLTALRIIAALAQESGYTLKYTSAEDFQKDIDAIEAISRTPMLVAPPEYTHEAKDVMPDSAWHPGCRPGVTEIVTHTAYRTSFRDSRIHEMVERWSHAIPPTVEEFKETVKESVAAKLRENDGDPTPEEEAAAVDAAAEKAHADAVEETARSADIHREFGSDTRNTSSRECYRTIIEQYM